MSQVRIFLLVVELLCWFNIICR